MKDPYQVLGISPSATEDEIKKAYRSLAKKYHPDVNNGSPDAEKKMKEINEAYSTILKMRRDGDSSYYAGRNGAYGGYYGQDPFSGYGAGQQSPELTAARNYIQAGYYREALHVLEGIQDRTAEWFYLSAIANSGIGNRMLALEHARNAASMQPDSLEYRRLVEYLEHGVGGYQNAARAYGFTDISQTLCWSALAAMCCMGGGCMPCFCCC